MKKIYIIFCVLILIIIFCIFSISFGNEKINEDKKNNVSEKYIEGIVLADNLNIRSGLGIDFECVGKLSQNEKVKIYDKQNDWYVIRTSNNIIGAVYSEYIKTKDNETIEVNANVVEDLNSLLLSKDEQIFLNLINNNRIENNLQEFEIDENVLNIARLKCKDLIENKYFSHKSLKYGTIFDMLKNSNILYYKASENIVKSDSADNALKILMNSDNHKKNILSQEYNYTGIAVQKNYDGKNIYVEVFISK